VSTNLLVDTIVRHPLPRGKVGTQDAHAHRTAGAAGHPRPLGARRRLRPGPAEGAGEHAV